jgi:hypothetical protein
MRNLSIRLVGLAAVALLAILVLAIMSVVEGRYDLLLVGLIGVVGVGLALTAAGVSDQAGDGQGTVGSPS